MEHTHTKKKKVHQFRQQDSAHMQQLYIPLSSFFFLLTFIMSLDMINRLIKADFCAAWVSFFSFQRVLP